MAGEIMGSRWTDALLDGMRELGDPVADVPVAAVLDGGGVDAVNVVMQTLVGVDQPVPSELPDALRNYLDDTLALPVWADRAKIERGQLLFEKWGIYVCVCLFCASLPSSYAAAKGVQVLHLTARLDTDTKRRILETGQFLFDVLSVGGLDDDGRGRRTIQRVRLMHAAVRHLIKARSEIDPDVWHPDWGLPLNQEDLAGTLLSFSMVVVDPLRRLGVRVSNEDVEAYLHLWNVIGHLLGVRSEMLVRDADDATALVDAIRRRHFHASPEGRELTAALIELLDDMTPGRLVDAFNPALIRHLIGDETAEMLQVPMSRLVDDLGRLARIANWFFVHVLRRTERNLPGYHEISRAVVPFGHDLLEELFKRQRGGERPPFAIPTHLAAKWELAVPPRNTR